MKALMIVLFFIGHFPINLISQTIYKIGYSFGANNTVSLTEKSSNRTNGFNHLFLPNTWSNHWYLGIQKKKKEFLLAFDGGGLGVLWKARVFPNKYPYDDTPNIDGSTNMSIRTGIRARSRQNTNLLKLSLNYKHTWLFQNNIIHKSILGIGYLKTRKSNGYSVHGFAEYDDSLGWIAHNMFMDKFQYYRLANFYLIGGYELSYKLNAHWNINAQIIYNQGLFRMIRFHTYRTYTESLTGYSEFDEQWSFTHLSYAAFLTGVSYNFTFKKKKQEVNTED